LAPEHEQDLNLRTAGGAKTQLLQVVDLRAVECFDEWAAQHRAGLGQPVDSINDLAAGSFQVSSFTWQCG